MHTLMLAICCFGLLQDESPEGTELKDRVGRLVRQLDDDQLARRHAAEQTLVELGPKILALLPHDRSRASAEVKERLGRIRHKLQMEFARQSVQATHVTLNGEMTAVEALDAIERQTGNQLDGYQDSKAKVVVDFRQVPFWKAMDEVLDQARLTIEPFAGRPQTLVIVPRSAERSGRRRQVCYQGMFRFEPTFIAATRDLRDATLAGLRLRLAISWEPRATPILLSQPLALIEARDDRGRLISPGSGRGVLEAAIGADDNVVEWELPLQLPDRGARRIAKLKGTVYALIPGHQELFEFTDLDAANNVQQRRAGTTVTLERVRKNDDVVEIRLRVDYDDADTALESHRGWFYRNEAYLVDSDGTRLHHGGQRETSRGEHGVGIAYFFAPDQPIAKYKLAYRTPTLIMTQPIAFELRDIDLP